MAKKAKIDKNLKSRKELAKRILDGEVVKSFSRTLKFDSVEKQDRSPTGWDGDACWYARVLKDGTIIPGHGKTKLDAVIDCIKHMENMGCYFETFTYTMSEAPELYKNGLLKPTGADLIEEDKEDKTKSEKPQKKTKKKPPAMAAKKLKQLPFL